MDKIKTVKIKNPDGSISEETYTISVDAKDVDMKNGKDLQDTVGDINIDRDGNISNQLLALKNTDDNIQEDILILETETKKKVYYFNTVNDMKIANLKKGDFVITLGYYSANDDGGAEYKIVDGNHIDDGGSYHKLNNNLYAELIVKNATVSVKQFGAHGDDSTDDTIYFQNIIAYIDNKYMNMYINKGKYIITSPLYVDWKNTNFWQTFNGSYSIKGAGMYESILKFNTSNGLHINRNTNILSINIEEFSVTNESYNPFIEENITRRPDDTRGIGLLLNHIGYTGRVTRVGVSGFYIGIATRHCYGGPILNNLFTKNNVFGYSSKSDTSLEHHSCNYAGYETCYIQEGSTMTLTNIICEGTLPAFKTNTNDRRSKFSGHGFVFYGGNITLLGCYTEHLYGNSRYLENCSIIDDKGIIGNGVVWALDYEDGYADLKAWLQTHEHNYDDLYINMTDQTNGNYHINDPLSLETAYINTNTLYSVRLDADGKYIAPNVIINGIRTNRGLENVVSKLSHGNMKPIVYLKGDLETSHQNNYSILPAQMYGVANIKNGLYRGNWNGVDTLGISRFSDSYEHASEYNEVKLVMRHTLDGAIRFLRVTLLNGTQISSKEVMRINTDGTVVFPQNAS